MCSKKRAKRTMPSLYARFCNELFAIETTM